MPVYEHQSIDDKTNALASEATTASESWQTQLATNYTAALANTYKAPVNSVIQLANHGLNTNFNEVAYSPLDLTSTAGFIGNLAGQVTGTAIEFALLRRGASALLGTSITKAGAENIVKETVVKKVAVGATTGAFMGAILTPTAPTDKNAPDNFWLERTKQAGVSALTFGTMSGASSSIEAIGASASSKVTAAILKSKTINSFGGGALGGIIGSTSDDLIHGRSVDFNKAGHQALETALVGAGAHGFDKTIGLLSKPRLVGQEGGKTTYNRALSPITGESQQYIDLNSHSSLKPHIVKAQALERATKSAWFDEVDDSKRFPTLDGNKKADVVVVGGGIAGLQAANELAGHGFKVTLIEGQHIAAGTTGRMAAMVQGLPDAGFAKLESYGNATYTEMMNGLKNSKKAIVEQAQGLNSDFKPATSYKLSNWLTSYFARKELNALQKFEPEVSFATGTEAAKIYPSSHSVSIIPGEGYLHPRKFALSIASSGRFNVFEDSPVKGLTVGKANEPITVHTDSGTITTDKVVFATGGPAPLFQHLNKNVWEAQCFASKVRYNKPVEGNFIGSDDPAISYWRQVGDAKNEHVLFGGGGRLLGLQKPIAESNFLLRRLQRWLPGAELEKQWNGTIFISNDGMPIVAQHPMNPNLYSITGLGGTGLVLSDMAAKALRQALQNGRNYLSADRFNSKTKE